jgi:hypothetical protein
MDNSLQLLIILIIIYTVFANILNKKKQVPQRTEIPMDTQGEDSNDSSPQYSQDDVYLDILGNRLPASKKNNIPVEPVPSNNMEIKTDTDIFQLDIYTDSQQASVNFSQPMIVDTLRTNKRTLELKSKIKNPAKLREMILISEILNKPKALRR